MDVRKDYNKDPLQTNAETLQVLDRLLREEISAVGTYREALQKPTLEPRSEDLSRIESDHEDAVNLLRQRIMSLGGEPSTESGIWGSWSKAVEGSAKVFGNAAAAQALKEGEERGIQDYQAALGEVKLDPESWAILQTALMKLEAHVSALNRFIEAQAVR